MWAKLRLWTDKNQDGLAQPEELQRLESLGVDRISLDYRESRWTDEHGKRSRYVAGIQDGKDRRSDDVFLVAH